MVSKVEQKKGINKRFFRIPPIVAWIFPRRLWFGEKNNHVYLTFDDGPHPEITPWLLEVLKKENIKATFFWNGNQLEKYPEFLDQAIAEGHVVGHHGYKHSSSIRLKWEDFKENFDQSKNKVKSDLFRPPYGDLNSKQAKYALENGEIVMWSWLSYDFDLGISPQKIIQKAKSQIKEKDILVFHENEKTLHRIKEIIPPIIQIIRDKGLNFAVIEK